MNYEKYYNAGYTAYLSGVPLSVALKALATRADRSAFERGYRDAAGDAA